MTTHGLSKEPTYGSWRGMMDRCFNKTHRSYNRYGGAGIKVCETIRASPQGIIQLLGTRPEGKSIDRIESSEHYSCGQCDECKLNGWLMNVRWATRRQQNRNRKSNHNVSINGDTKCLTAWGETVGIDRRTMARRAQLGWGSDRLLSPVGSSRKNTKWVTINGVSKPAAQWAKVAGISRALLYYRIKLGLKDADGLLAKPRI